MLWQWEDGELVPELEAEMIAVGLLDLVADVDDDEKALDQMMESVALALEWRRMERALHD